LEKFENSKMTFISGWSLQPGLKSTPARNIRPRPRGKTLVKGYGQPGLNGRSPDWKTGTKSP
jgi:hypothetical protein